jgi:beta-lactamase regulating signal transducer with metallopeptidase domain/formylglycine-generating enzyme required for sulfatase activity/lipopolysaccharide export system protein LptA
MIAYIIKSSLSLILMFGLYWIFLRKEKLFRFNRFFLIFAILFSLIVPFISVPVNIQNNEVQKNIVTVLNYNIPDVTALSAPVPIQNSVIDNTNQAINQKLEREVVKSPGISFTLLLIILYFSGVVLLLFRFLRNILFISHQKRLSENIYYSGQKLILVDSQVNPYCFLNAIYVSKQDYLENRIDKELLNHEVQHIKQAHTIDIIFMELIQSFYWFNPILIFYNKAARVNHEYLADNSVLNISNDVKSYADILLNFISCRRNIPLTSGFNQSLTRKRLTMMVKPKSNRIFSGLKIAVTISLILIVSLFLSFKQLQIKPSGMAFIPYPVYDTIKMMESGKINRYVTYSEGFYISHEITNKEFREFTDWAKNNPSESIYVINDTSTFVKNPKTGKTREMIFHLPKRIDVSVIMNEFIVSKAPYSPDSNHQNYFNDERYDDYPVLGVSKRMAEYYCSWKTKAETIFIHDSTGGYYGTSSSIDYNYRLPSEKEWDFIAQHYADKDNTKLEKKEIEKSDEPGSIETGILHMDDNVSEWVTSAEDKRCIAKGGSWKKGSNISLKQTYDKDNEDETIGFRIVKFPRPKVTSGSNSFNTKEASNFSGKKESLETNKKILNQIPQSFNVVDQNVTYTASGYIRRDTVNKMVVLIDKAIVSFGEITIKADSIIFNIRENQIYAMGRLDGQGKILGKPIFKEGSKEFEADEIIYNFKTRQATVKNIVAQDSGSLIRLSTHDQIDKIITLGAKPVKPESFVIHIDKPVKVMASEPWVIVNQNVLGQNDTVKISASIN